MRLVAWQGRTSPLSISTGKLEPHEFAYTAEHDRTDSKNWGRSMVEDELEKRHPSRLADVIAMSDALLIDTVSAFAFPYLVTEPNERYFLRSKEWERYVTLRVRYKQKRLWEIPIELSITGLRKLLESLYERQPSLRVMFHFPRPCFNDGVDFQDPEVTVNVSYYHQYSDRLYLETSRCFPRVSVIQCREERANPDHYNDPFQYDDGYMKALRNEIERMLE